MSSRDRSATKASSVGTELKALSRRFGGKVLSARVYPEFFPLAPEDVVANLGCGTGAQVLAYGASFRRMIGIDISLRRLSQSCETLRDRKLGGYAAVCAMAESVPLRSESFDKVLAIDVIEHVVDPTAVCREMHRLLRSGGRLLVTFPAMHDRITDALTAMLRLVPRRNQRSRGFLPSSGQWNPDAHNNRLSLQSWINLVEGSGFMLRRSRASTLFPPLHLYGVPRVWFSNDTIHAVDARLCAIRGLRRLGQSLACDFERR